MKKGRGDGGMTNLMAVGGKTEGGREGRALFQSHEEVSPLKNLRDKNHRLPSPIGIA